MSTQIRSGGGGGGGGNINTNNNINNNRNQSTKKTNQINDQNVGGNKKTQDHNKTEKEKPHAKPTAEQIRIAQIVDIKSGSEDPKMSEKVSNLMELTERSEEEVCCALHECDNDLNRAVIFLLESLPLGSFETSSKKKKNRLTSVNNDANAGEGEWGNENSNTNSGSGQNTSSDTKERSRSRGGARGGRGGSGSDSRGWRGREARENERNTADSKGESWRGGRGGRGRGGYTGSRGGRGGRMGPRGRDQGRGKEIQEVDNWDNTQATTEVKVDDTWGDWDNEEYTGSLADTKVFTSSVSQSQSTTIPSSTELSAPPGLEQQVLNPPQQNDLVQQYSATVVSSTTTAAAVAAVTNNTSNNNVVYSDLHPSTVVANSQQHLRQALDMPQINSTPSASLSVEQSQYFNSLSSQNSNQQQANIVNSYQPNAVQYTGNYGTTNYADQVVSSQPPVRKQRVRMPPPSKIPSTAVEMPGDTLNNIGLLDVQFGGLDFGTDDTFDSLTEKFNSTNVIDTSQNVVTGVVQDVTNEYQPKPSVQQQQQSSLSSSLQNSQMNDNLTSGYVQRVPNNVAQTAANVNNVTANTNNVLVDQHQLNKNDNLQQYNQTNSMQMSGYQDVGGSYNQQNNKTTSTSSNNNKNVASVNNVVGVNYQTVSSTQQSGGYNTNNYNTNSQQQSTTNNYQPSSSTYSTYNPTAGVNSYQQQQQQQSNTQIPISNVALNTNNTSAVSSNSTQSLPVVNSNNVNNTSTNTNAGYLSSPYPASQATSAFPSQQSGYQNSQSVYGNSGLANNAGYTGNTSASSTQYSNFSSTKLKENSTPVSTPFESVVTSNTVSSSPSSVVTNSSVITTSSMSSPSSLGLTNTKVATNNNATNVKGVTSGIVGASTGVTSGVGNTTGSSGTGSSGNNSGGSGSAGGVLQNNIMVGQYIQGMPFYQQPVYSYEDLQIMQQRMPPPVPGYCDFNYQTPPSLGAAGVRDGNLGSVAYSTLADGRTFTRTDNNSSPVSNVPSTMAQQTGSGGPLMNLPYAYFYGGNMMPSGFQYGTAAIYPPMQSTSTSGGQFAKPSYNSAYGSAGYDSLSQTVPEYKGTFFGASVGQQSKGQTVANQQPTITGAADTTTSTYGKSHVALNKVNSYDKQSFHSGTPPPFNLAGTQTAGATSAQAYGAQHMYIPAMPAPHHNMNMHQPMHQMDGRTHSSSRRDSNTTGQRQQSSSQSKTGAKQGYSTPSYWAAQN